MSLGRCCVEWGLAQVTETTMGVLIKSRQWQRKHKSKQAWSDIKRRLNRDTPRVVQNEAAMKEAKETVSQ